MLGLLTFLDPPRPDTRRTLEAAAGLGVQTRMVRARARCSLPLFSYQPPMEVQAHSSWVPCPSCCEGFAVTVYSGQDPTGLRIWGAPG